jgi:hypothetical protein
LLPLPVFLDLSSCRDANVKPIVAALLATLCLFVIFQGSGNVGARRINLYTAYDFGLFYCAGQALDEHMNPYTMEPLRTCEKSVERSEYLPDSVAEPAPLPGYSLALFALLGQLPFVAAKLVWLLIECFALVISTMLLARMTRLPIVAIATVLFLAGGILSVTWGQLPPVAIASLVCAAYFMRERREPLAAIATAVALIEPHLGLPAALALLVWAPRTRLSLILSLALLGLTHFLILGWQTGIAYFATVLPGMAFSEAHAADQFSLMWLMHYFGAPDAVAVHAGTISYIVMLGVGLLTAGWVAARRNDDALLVLLPPAIVLIGGSYVHQIQVPAAIPAALVMGSASQGRLRTFFLLTAAVLTVPWFSAIHSRLLTVLSVVVATIFVALSLGGRSVAVKLDRGMLAGLVCLTLLIALRFLPIEPSSAPVAQTPAPITATSLASQSWGSYIRSEAILSSTGPRIIASKLPTWGALLLLLLGSIAFAIEAPLHAIRQLREKSCDHQPV